jgi:hypothetical protein
MALFRHPPLRVVVAPDRIALIREDGKRWDHPAQVWWDDHAKRVTGIGIGPIPRATRIPLFEPTPVDGIPKDKLALLERFFILALGETVKEQFLRLKPNVIVEGADSLAPALAGYQRGVLRAALLAGGAMTVTFE